MSTIVPFEMTPTASDPRRVAYYYDPDVGLYHYYLGHPMKPHRIRMAHNLIVNYGLCDDSDAGAAGPDGEGSRSMNDPLTGAGVADGVAPGEERMAGVTEHRGGSGKAMQIFRPRRATKHDMTKFHSDEFIEVLEKVNPDNQAELTGGGMRGTCPCSLMYAVRSSCGSVDGRRLSGLRGAVGVLPDLGGRITRSVGRWTRGSALMSARSGRQDQFGRSGHCHQLGWRPASLQKDRGERFLLRQRHRACHSGASAVGPP